MIASRRLTAALALAAALAGAPPAPAGAACAQEEAAPRGRETLVQRYYTLGRALEEEGHDAEAREQYQRVLEREARHLPTLHALALLERRAEDLDAALDYAGRFLDTWRHLDPAPRELLAARTELERLLREADPMRARLDALRRTYVGRLLKLADQRMDKAGWHSARAILAEALATDPEHPELAAGLARIRLEGGNELAVEDETGGADPLAGVTVEWVEENDPLHATWETAWTAETEHYRLRTNAGYRLLRTVANAMEQMHEFYRIFHRYKTDGGSVPVAGVHIFKDRDEYKSLGRSPQDWAAGHWDGSKVVTYDQRGGGDGSLRGTLQVLFHEASHQFTSLAGGSGVPAWLNEGMASFFEGTRLLSNGKVDWNLVAPGRLYPLVKELREPDRNHLQNVIRGEVDDYRVYYPWGWGIVYYLYNAEDETGRLLYRTLLPEYFQKYEGIDHIGRFTEFFIEEAKVPGVKSLEDFEERFIAAMFRLEEEDRGQVDAARAYEERGDLQVALEEWERAVELYDRSLERDPDHPEVLWKLAYALERRGDDAALDRAAGTLRRWLSVVELDGDESELARARSEEARERIRRLDPVARNLESARTEYHAESVALAREYREAGFPRTALRVLQGPATAEPPSADARELYFAIQDESGVSLERWELLFNEADLSGFYGDGLENFRVSEGTILANIVIPSADGGRPRRPRGGGQRPLTGAARREGEVFLFRRLFIDREPAGDWSLAADVAVGAEGRMAGLCFGKKESGVFHGVVLLPEGVVDLGMFELDGTPLVRTAANLKPDWNRLQIDVAGTRLVVHVNGALLIDHQFDTRAELEGDFGLLAGEGRSSYREIKMLEYDRNIPRRVRIGRRPAGARLSEGGSYAAPERAQPGATTFLGSAPPLLRGLTWVGEAPEGGDLDRLLGWPVLLVFTKTGVEATHPVLPALAKVRERHGELDIPVLIVSNEEHDEVAAWVERQEVPYAVASCWEQEAYEDYDLKHHGVPRVLVLDLDGTVVWEGNPDWAEEYGAYFDEPLDKLVAERKLVELRTAPGKLSAAEEAFRAERYAEALAAWKAVADLEVGHPTVAAAKAGLRRLEALAAGRVEEAASLEAAGRLLQAKALLEDVAARLDGTRAGVQAAERAAAMAETGEYRKALRAGNRIERAERQLDAGRLDHLRAELEKLLEKAAPDDDPWPAERARWLLEGIGAGLDADALREGYHTTWPLLAA